MRMEICLIRGDKKGKILKLSNCSANSVINVLANLTIFEPLPWRLTSFENNPLLLKYVNKIARSRFYVFSLLCMDNAAVILRVFVCLMCYLKHFYVLTSIGVLYDNNQASFWGRCGLPGG